MNSAILFVFYLVSAGLFIVGLRELMKDLLAEYKINLA
tara:strand:+ start:392 stop:505 length:114 start_codon:yes stop_codon:yes gene_type:complete